MHRWVHADMRNPGEARYVTETLERIDRWWEAFVQREEEICAMFELRATEWDLAAWMQEHLQAIDPRLMWEFGPALHRSGHRLVITPEMNQFLRPIVDTILDRSPDLERWEFYGYRLAEGFDAVAYAVQGRTGGDVSDLRVCVNPGNHGLIDLTFVSPRLRDDDDRSRRIKEAFVAAETLLGEEALDKWIGLIDVISVRDSADWDPLPLPELPANFRDAVEHWTSELATAPCLEWIDEETEWTGWELTRLDDDGQPIGLREAALAEAGGLGPNGDYPDRADLLLVISGYAKFTSAALGRHHLYSSCFSLREETFCYLKIDAIDGIETDKFADRSEIEDALNRALKPESIGCVIAGGTGRRYAYVDLALLNVPIAIPVIRRVLRWGRLPERTWLLFFDAPLKAEWVGLYDNTPPPPMAASRPR